MSIDMPGQADRLDLGGGDWEDDEKPCARDTFPEVTLGCLQKSNPLRSFLIEVTVHRVFSSLVLVAIVANCVFLAMWDPTDTDPNSDKNLMLEKAELGFQLFFTIEMFMKLLVKLMVSK